MGTSDPVQAEIALQKVVAAYVVTGFAFLVLPGTFLGVWNLICISSRHAPGTLSPAWVQAYGHAQIFGWLGTFIAGQAADGRVRLCGPPVSLAAGPRT